jgi:uncharacterized protein (TIGR02452 family)
MPIAQTAGIIAQHKMQIIVTPDDTLEAVCKLLSSGSKRVGFLVFANATNPGGRYKDGSPAQEESICRRTNLVSCFDRMNYPVAEFGSFYIKDLAIIRDVEKSGYTYLNNIVTADCVVAAAYHAPPIDYDGKIAVGYRERTRIKIQQVLNAFVANGNDEIVLGAFGCGAFSNPVEDMAQIFKSVLGGDMYRGIFKTVVFAVMKDMSGVNYNAFVSVFANNN